MGTYRNSRGVWNPNTIRSAAEKKADSIFGQYLDARKPSRNTMKVIRSRPAEIDRQVDAATNGKKKRKR